MTRQKIGYYLAIIALVMLTAGYLAGLWFSYTGEIARTFLGACITVVPLFYLMPGVLKGSAKSYVALALLAPLQLFFGGVIWLWGQPYWGMWVCLWAVILQTGAILHNYVKKQKNIPS